MTRITKAQLDNIITAALHIFIAPHTNTKSRVG